MANTKVAMLASVKNFFTVYPSASEVFETFDGILHPTEDIANKWIARFGSKKVTRYVNPDLEEKQGGSTATVASGEGDNSSKTGQAAEAPNGEETSSVAGEATPVNPAKGQNVGKLKAAPVADPAKGQAAPETNSPVVGEAVQAENQAVQENGAPASGTAPEVDQAKK